MVICQNPSHLHRAEDAVLSGLDPVTATNFENNIAGVHSGNMLSKLLMILSILSLLLPLEIGGDRILYSDHRIALFAAASPYGGSAFLSYHDASR
jgi:hypothetical protein